MSECECPMAGWCERYQRQQSCRSHEICSGNWSGQWKELTPAEREGYRKLWTKAIGKETKRKAQMPKGPPGPGTIFKSILASHWIQEKIGCNCSEHAKQMDAWGPEGCEEHFETIVGWLKEEAAKRKLPWALPVEYYLRTLVKLAIVRSRRAINRANRR